MAKKIKRVNSQVKVSQPASVHGHFTRLRKSVQAISESQKDDSTCEVSKPKVKERSCSALGQKKPVIKTNLLEKYSPSIKSERGKAKQTKSTTQKLTGLANMARNNASRNIKSNKSDLRAPLSTTISQST